MRYLAKYILDDVAKKMVFLRGPRQSGKTTLVTDMLKNYPEFILIGTIKTTASRF
jgi:predicted AAA+ superfamily ATPase